MKIVIWIVQILVALAFLSAGLMKLITPYPDLISDPNMAWAGDFSATQIKLIAVLEILGVLGLVLPMIIKKFKALVPIAAFGLALTMVGAIITHIGRDEPIAVNLVLLVLASLTAWWRRGFLKKKIS
jgi:uncharacterized membrane protein YphA (DoxX/SURF4 family)